MFIRNIYVSLCSINLCLENGPEKSVFENIFVKYTKYGDQIQIKIYGLKFDQIQIQIQIHRICICIYKYVSDPNRHWRAKFGLFKLNLTLNIKVNRSTKL